MGVKGCFKKTATKLDNTQIHLCQRTCFYQILQDKNVENQDNLEPDFA